MASTARLKAAKEQGKAELTWAWKLERAGGTRGGEEFRCPECGSAQLSFVGASRRGDGEAMTRVHAHFRLKPGQEHAIGCQLAHRDGLPTQPPRGKGDAEGAGPGHEDCRQRTPAVFDLSGLHPDQSDPDVVAATAVGILELTEDLLRRGMSEGSAPARALMTMWLGGPLSWNQVFYEPGCYGQLADTEPKHPVIIVGEIVRVTTKPPREGSSHATAVISLHGATTGLPSASIVPSVTISAAFAEKFRSGQSVLILGFVSVNRASSDRTFLNMRIRKVRQLRVLA